MTALVLTGIVLCGSFGVEASAATLYKTMSWNGNSVTVKTRASVANDTRYATVFVYDKNGVCITSKSGNSGDEASATANNSNTASAMGVHYAKDGSGTVYGYKEYKVNKGINYSY